MLMSVEVKVDWALRVSRFEKVGIGLRIGQICQHLSCIASDGGGRFLERGRIISPGSLPLLSRVKLKEVRNRPDLTTTFCWDCDLTCLFFDEEAAGGRLED